MVNKCDIKIMASPKRYVHVLNTCNVLGLDIDADVFFDDRPNGGDAFYTFKKTILLPFDDGITHRVVLQDDLLLCHDFKNTVNRLISLKQNAIFTLHCSRSVIKKDWVVKDSPSIIKINGCCVWGQANVFPIDMIEDMFKWAHKNIGANIIHDDSLVGQFAKANGIEVYTTAPGLVQHLEPNSSLLGFNDKRKTSKVFDMNCDKYNWENFSEKIVNISAFDF